MTSGAVSTINEIVKPMERGQITIPLKIRKKLKITPQSWLWVKLIKDKILIEPVEKKSLSGPLADYLLSASADSQIYWSKEDTNILKKISKKSQEKLLKVV